MAENEGTPSGNEPAPNNGTAPAGGTTGSGTPQTPDEVTLLRSRNAGLDAKVTELTKAQQAAEAKAAEALQKLADYEAGKVGADEALRAQLAQAKAETEKVRKEATLARIEVKFPEAFKELGELAATFSEEKLASLEARLSGGADAGEPPTPRGNTPSKTGQGQPEKKMTKEDVIASLKALPNPFARD